MDSSRLTLHANSPTAFIGRADEVETVLNLLRDPFVRLVTVLGVGGVGKSRFAQELAGRLQVEFHHGAVFVPLAPLTKPEELIPALAGSLGAHLTSGSDLRRLILDILSNQEMLLVLDNFEHLLDEAILIRDILDTALRVKVLVTSREKLKLESEILYPLRGLV